MSHVWAFFASALAGVAASMGLGGGAVLLLYLSTFSGIAQLNAQGINLIFFLPIAFIALLLHAKAGLIRYRPAFWCILFGIPGVFLGLWLTSMLHPEFLRRLFAIFLFFMGLRELFAKKESSAS